MNNLEQFFAECKSSLTFKRIPAEYKLDIYLGYNNKVQKTLAYITDKVDETFQSTRLIDLNINTRRDGKKAVCFCLVEETDSDIFYRFCQDIIESTKDVSNENGLKIINARWNRWINMFKNPFSKILSENEIRGLIGELVFLRDYMFDKYGIEKSIESWEGPDSSHKDIEIENTWYEIKTTPQGATTVKISSIEQLDSDKNGYLTIIELEKTNSNVSGFLTLNKLVEEISLMLPNNSIIKEYYKKLSTMGYSYYEEYESFVYDKKNIKFYSVNDKFPRLKAIDMPNQVAKVSYELIIPNIKEFMVED